MIRKARTRRKIAVFFLGLLTVQTLYPTFAHALTSGPTQPESKQFAAAGTSDMVDLFTGDFKYNIPLLDVEGYPVNLNYASGSGMDDEATWVGLGWNLNVGAVNRSLRGIPDDASGDTVVTDAYTKPKITYGGRGTIRTEVFGNDMIKIGGSLTVGVFSDSYTGLGAEFGANAGIKLTMGGTMTGNLGVNALSSTSNGVDVDLKTSLTLAGSDMINGTKERASTSISLGYNTRQGLKDLTLSQSFGSGYVPNNLGATFSFNTPAFYPKAVNDYRSSNSTYSLDVGGMAWGIFAGGGVTGYKHIRQLAATTYKRPAYGMLYAARGKTNPGALMDFMREKDNPVVKGMPNLAIPVVTPDIFTYSGQAGSGQFRVYSGGSGVFFDPAARDVSNNSTLGGDIGFGGYVHGGVTFYKQNNEGITGKWTNQNDFLAKGDFRDERNLIGNEEPAYFKQMGEKNLADPAFTGRVKDEEVVSVKISGKSATGDFRAGNNNYSSASPYKKDGRQLRSAPIAYLTAKEAAAQEKDINNYPFNQFGSFTPQSCNNVLVKKINRCQDYRKPAHISEISIQSEDGQRMVYGLPVYNIKQEEYAFAVNPANANTATNRVSISGSNGSVNHTAGLDDYYNKETQPAYATSHLLTALLSPDYADITGDGITPDDRGTAVKFNYSKVEGAYKWRTPYEASQAMYNRALYADKLDDKGTIVYGEKELWYLHTIESRNMIAYFITDDREDGLGVNGYMGGKNDVIKQKRLREIRLYSRNDLTTPIKTVVFEYDYSLCTGVPNSNAGGKLTLKKVYFKYASSSKGANHPYEFTYRNDKGFDLLATDRWGTYKPGTANAAAGWPALRNDEFPYSIQQDDVAKENAGIWQLKTISLPTGGIINVDYEPDDYAYVQDRRAMQMTQIQGMIKENGSLTDNLKDARGLRVKIPYAKNNGEATSWFTREYLDNSRTMYARLYTNVSDRPQDTDEQYFDFIPAYMQVRKVTIAGSGTANTYADVFFEDKKEGGIAVNPALMAAWQKMRLDYPCYAYPGFRNRVQDDRPASSALKQIITAVSNFRELRENFYARAYRLGFASKVKLEKSFARIVKQDGKKKGGGWRVKMIRMSDNWQAMSGEAGDVSYGQAYEYTTSISATDDRQISSGVAAYEPSVGGDENALHMPVEYTEDVKGGLSNYFYLEKPFGESLYPAPQVGYSKVTVKRLNGANAADPLNKTGWDVTEFYTARDFPVIVKAEAKPDAYNHQSNRSFLFFGANAVHEQVLSQGYAIILNDMHGKLRAERSFNKAGAEISSTVMEYDAEPWDASSFRLRNRVKVIDDQGVIDAQEQVLGREIELFTDMREQETKNFGQTFALGVDIIPGIFSFPLPIPHFPISLNKEYRLFRSASVLKTIHYSGIVKKVIRNIDGSTISAENLVYDKLTGQPVLTSTQNEFNDPVYTLHIPAYWVYKNMGGAYKNINTVLRDLTTSSADGSAPLSYSALLAPGDELVSVDNGERLWVIRDETGGSRLKLIDETGKLKKSYLGTVKICRSGYRNQLGAATATITCLRNPVGLDRRIALFNNEELQRFSVIDAKATLFDERWGMPDCLQQPCPDGYTLGEDGNCVKLPDVNNADGLNTCQIFSPSYNFRGVGFYSSLSAASTNDTVRSIYWGEPAPYDAVIGRMNLAGLKLCTSPSPYGDAWAGVSGCFISEGGPHYLGFSGTGHTRVYLDGVLLKERPESLGDINYTRFHMYPLTIPEGRHTLSVECRVTGSPSDVPAMVAEIYNADLAALRLGNATALNNYRVFSTATLRLNPTAMTYVKNASGTVIAQKYTCSAGTLNYCGTPNCGSVSSFNCPPGYTDVTGLGKCAIFSSGSNDDVFKIVQGDKYPDYGIFGAFFYDASNKLIAKRKDNYWNTCTTQIFSSGFAPSSSQKTALAKSSGSSTDTLSANQPKMKGTSSMMATTTSTTVNYCGRLNDCGIWLGGNRYTTTDGKWWSVQPCFFAPRSGIYYIGHAVDNNLKLDVDNVRVTEFLENSNRSVTQWKVQPIYLNAGHHHLRISALNFADGGYASVGVEIYNNTIDQLLAGNNISTIFSTKDLIGTNANTAIYYNPDVPTWRYTCGAPDVPAFTGCNINPYCNIIAKGNVINPYLYGFLGNWRPSEAKVFQTSREEKNRFDNTTTKGLDIRNSGTYNTFRPFWFLQNGQWQRDVTSAADNSDVLWVTSSYITRYNARGADIENKDALGRYSSSYYGFNQSLPTAVAANAQSREIFYEGFDDYQFNQRCNKTAYCQPDSFAFNPGNTAAGTLSSAYAHSGNYSYQLSGTTTMQTLVHTLEHKPGIYLGNNIAGEYFRQYLPGLFKGGFSPAGGRKYIVSVWVKHPDLKNDDPGFTLTANSNAVTFSRKATVEGWKLMEGEINMVSGPLTLTWQSTSSGVYLDDLRIFPYDAQIRTFAYDDKTMRLMAELDENNYASFYEYDDEGTLVRVKKETERGIVTVKESRSAYRKN